MEHRIPAGYSMKLSGLYTSFSKSGSDYYQNANFEQAGWKENSFDDSLWEIVSVKEFTNDGYLIKSEIPFPVRNAVKAQGIWVHGCDTISGFYC